MNGLKGISPPNVLYRIARRPDPWSWPAWEHCKKANRWDDPSDNYRVLYASSQRLATFIETLARFRKDPVLIAALAEITGEDDGALPPGHVPASWITARTMGTATVDGRFADVGHSQSLAHLQVAMAARLIHYGIPELDGSVIRESRREFTQEVSLYVFSQATVSGGAPAFAGIAYESRLGSEFMNWAIFERPDRDAVREASSTAFGEDDPDLTKALTRFDLGLARGF
jgi:RES domain-containing protein